MTSPNKAGLRVPPGVFHTPGGVGQTLSGEWDTRGTPWDTQAENLGNSRVSGVPFFSEPWDTVGQQVSHFPKTRGTPRLQGPLNALVLAYRRGEITQEAAAKLCEIRKETFAELATAHALETFGTLWERVQRDVQWHAYLRRFLATFPECDARAVRRESRPEKNADDLWRPFPEQPVRTYGPEAAATLPPSAGALDQSGTGTQHLWENSSSETVRSPATIARALARAKGQQQFEEPESEELSFDGPEFEFDAEDASHRGGGSVLGP